MHIKKAKAQIKNAIIAYSTKDSHGRYRIPVSKQRPVFLVGAPGIGKTAIVEQIARELGEENGVTERTMLYSKHEWKKTCMKYFCE